MKILCPCEAPRKALLALIKPTLEAADRIATVADCLLFTLGEWKLEGVILPLADVPAHIRASLAVLPSGELCFAVRLAGGEVLDVGLASELRRIVSCGARLPLAPAGEA